MGASDDASCRAKLLRALVAAYYLSDMHKIAVVVVLLLSVALSSCDASGGKDCCATCSANSKPCGDSCISKGKTCQKGSGCAYSAKSIMR